MPTPALQLPPVLRYRLRVKPGDRPSSLTNSGEPLCYSEPGPHYDTGMPGPPFPGRCLDAISPANDSTCDWPPSWMGQFPTDFVHSQNLVPPFGVKTGTAVLPGLAAAAAAAVDGRTFWMGEQMAVLQTPPLLPPTAISGLLNWSHPDARRCTATTMCAGDAGDAGGIPALADTAWNGFAAIVDPKWHSTSSCKKLPAMEVRGRA